jgi:hypothetical protein
MNKCRVPEIGDALYICSFANAWADRVQICKYEGRPPLEKKNPSQTQRKKENGPGRSRPGPMLCITCANITIRDDEKGIALGRE